MTRDDVVGLLRLRAHLCSQPYSGDMAESWLDVLADYDIGAARQALLGLVRGGATKVSVGQIAERCVVADGRETTPLSADEVLAYASQRIAYLNARDASLVQTARASRTRPETDHVQTARAPRTRDASRPEF